MKLATLMIEEVHELPAQVSVTLTYSEEDGRKLLKQARRALSIDDQEDILISEFLRRAMIETAARLEAEDALARPPPACHHLSSMGSLDAAISFAGNGRVRKADTTPARAKAHKRPRNDGIVRTVRRTTRPAPVAEKDEEHNPYICTQCAARLGGKWPKGHCATFHGGTCSYCQKTKSLCAIDDFDWPRNSSRPHGPGGGRD